MSQNLEEFSAEVRRLAAVAGDGFTNPNADWPPALIWEDSESGMGVADIGPAFADQARKEAFVALLPELLAQLQADRAALVLSTWSKHVESGSEYGGPGSLAEDPNSVEFLTVLASDGCSEQHWEAPIVRDELRPPHLGEWECRDEARGLIGGALRRALRRARRA